ncbi:uncharacterized protein LOC118516997 isoform X7 [Anopheles stephensi]|uniref:uncharacterized protein LOC118516997 isoform X7 n=2 Tax=Anopheles stephensi TaxID=30069 RepID=UPI0016588D4D|nr:uncharacterized protein LOC118516997 isoform X7 [Anopheles stephensi]
MASKKMRTDGSLFKKRRQYMEQLEREWQAEQQANLPGPSVVSSVQRPELDANTTVETLHAATGQSVSGNHTEKITINSSGGVAGDERGVQYSSVDQEADMDFDVHEDNDCQDDVEDIYMESDTTYSFFDNITLAEGLRYIAVTKNLSRSTVNMILALLRRKLNVLLPTDSRTLLKTPSQVGLEIQPISGGQYWYRGIETALRNYFQDNIPPVNQLSFQISIDGLPLHNSSARQLWPILMKVEELPEAPVMLVGAYCGYTKPDNIEQYLRPLVTEINELHERGLMFGDKMVHTKLRMFVADSPARCFVNATISFVGKHSCLKCSCVGVHEANKKQF